MRWLVWEEGKDEYGLRKEEEYRAVRVCGVVNY